MKEDEIGRAYGLHRGEKISAYTGLMWKPAGKKVLRRPRHKWEDNIKIGLKDRICRGNHELWIQLAVIGTGGRLL